MLNLVFYRERSGWKGFRARGHAYYAKHGEDIVCAALSALTQTAVLGLREVIGIHCQVQVDEDAGMLLCLLPDDLSQEEWKQAQIVLDVLYVGALAIEEDYGTHVNVKEVPYRENKSAIIRLKKGWRKHEKRQRLSSPTLRREES
ncbi:MAG: ribosomal-processing cysteine protease Prp [Limnochordia bacterium]|jgi:uncharacterized protein YsxB (DUF464 family)